MGLFNNMWDYSIIFHVDFLSAFSFPVKRINCMVSIEGCVIRNTWMIYSVQSEISV